MKWRAFFVRTLFLTVLLPLEVLAQGTRLALTIPTTAARCETQPAPGPSLFGPKEVRAAVAGSSPTDIRIVIVTRDPKLSLTLLTNIQAVATPSGAPDLVTTTVNIDPKGVMTGQDAKPGSWTLDAKEQTTVKGMIAWYDKICPAPKP